MTRPWESDLVVTRPGRPDLVVPAAALRWRFSRSGGPGGQGVNTSDSRVELSLDLAGPPGPAGPTGLTGLPGLPGLDDAERARLLGRLADRLHAGVLTVVAADDRSQLRNRQAARERLAAVLRAGLAPDPPTRRATTPSRRARARRVESKKRRGDVKRMRRRPGTE